MTTLKCGCVLGDSAAGVKHSRCAEGRRLRDETLRCDCEAQEALERALSQWRDVWRYRYSEAKRHELEHLLPEEVLNDA